MPMSGPKRVDLPTYAAMHLRLNRDRGPASDFACAHCGGAAADWAYDHCDPEELMGFARPGKAAVPYSADQAHYVPLCRSCHYRLDHQLSRTCIRGHAWTAENTYVDPQGWRHCRECIRLRKAARRAAA